MGKLISIITPSYNNGQYIRGCIDSIRQQTYTECEHIVIDGASTDHTLQILAQYPHLKWHSAPDQGMYDAINKGIHLATGEIIGYLNADDFYFPETLARVASVFANHPQVDFVYGDTAIVNEQVKCLYRLRAVPFFPFTAYAGRVTWGQPTCFWRAQVNERIGNFASSMKNFGDNEFFRRMLKHKLRGYYIAQPLAKFRLREDCITRKFIANAKYELQLINKMYPRKRYTLGNISNEILFLMRNLPTIPYRLYYKFYKQLI